MKEITQKYIKTLFSNLCCSRCKNEFDINSINVTKELKDILICNLTCQKCGKNFGEIVLNYKKTATKHSPLKIIDGPSPITIDDVIDAHKFIQQKL